MAEETKTTAPTKAPPKTAQASVCQAAVAQRVAAIGRYHLSQASRRWRTSWGPIPVTLTSFPAGAVVAVRNRWRASRSWRAPRSWTARSTAGRHDEVITVGAAKTARSPSKGWIEASSPTVRTRRSTHPAVVNSDMYMWSSTNTWSRSTDRRSRYSGLSWWAMVATEAWRRATWDSRAMVTLSRKRRWTRVLTVRSSQVAVADKPNPTAAASTRPLRWCTRPWPRTASHRASKASGTAATRDRTKAASSRKGSCWYPSRHSRHMAGRAAGILSGAAPDADARSEGGASDEDVIGPPLLIVGGLEPAGLQPEHRAVPAASCDQLGVGAQLHDPPVLQHADPVGVAHGREAVGDQDRGHVPGGGQDALEDGCLSPHVELSGGLVEQHETGAHPYRAQSTGQGHPLPLATGEVRAARVAPCQRRVQRRQPFGSGVCQRSPDDLVGRSCRRHVVSQGKLEVDEVLEHRGDLRAPAVDVQVAQVYAVDLDGAAGRLVEPAQELGQRGLARSVLAHDGE